jgi:hypothetical protein
MLDSTLNAALAGQALRQFLAIRIELIEGGAINLIDGSGTVTFSASGSPVTFEGLDPVYGALASVENMSERVATEAPRLSFTLLPPSDSSLGQLSDPVNQGSSVRVWWGIVNEATGAPIGEPELLWSGRLDNVSTKLGEKTRTCEIDTVSAFDRLFVAEEAARLNGVWHKNIWPDETGLDFNIAAALDPFWGVEAPARPSVTTSSGHGGGGGGIGGGSSDDSGVDPRFVIGLSGWGG